MSVCVAMDIAIGCQQSLLSGTAKWPMLGEGGMSLGPCVLVVHMLSVAKFSVLFM